MVIPQRRFCFSHGYAGHDASWIWRVYVLRQGKGGFVHHRITQDTAFRYRKAGCKVFVEVPFDQGITYVMSMEFLDLPRRLISMSD
jgi:hypothetical protein